MHDRNLSDCEKRWDIHTERQLNAAKGGVAAVTLLSSGSWLALLTQADKLVSASTKEQAGAVIFAWGMGAFLGTLCWLFIYLSTLFQYEHDVDQAKKFPAICLEVTRYIGLGCVIASLGCFAYGLYLIKATLAG